MDDLLSGKNIFLSGAGPNIGRAIALETAAQGAAIYFIEKDEARCNALQRELALRGFRAQGFACDVSQPAEIDEVLAQLDAQEVVIHVVVHNAGVHFQHLPAEWTQFARWQRMMETNVLGPLYLSRRLADKMVENGVAGNLLFLSSVHRDNFSGDAIYSASKAALDMIIKELAVALSPHGIRVNGIAPGDCRQAPDGTPSPHPKTALGHCSVQPVHIARAALFLASDYFSAQTTGTTLVVDGGLSLYSFASQNVIAPLPAPSLARRVARRGKSELRKWRNILR